MCFLEISPSDNPFERRAKTDEILRVNIDHVTTNQTAIVNALNKPRIRDGNTYERQSCAQVLGMSLEVQRMNLLGA